MNMLLAFACFDVGSGILVPYMPLAYPSLDD